MNQSPKRPLITMILIGAFLVIGIGGAIFWSLADNKETPTPSTPVTGQEDTSVPGDESTTNPEETPPISTDEEEIETITEGENASPTDETEDTQGSGNTTQGSDNPTPPTATVDKGNWSSTLPTTATNEQLIAEAKKAKKEGYSKVTYGSFATADIKGNQGVLTRNQTGTASVTGNIHYYYQIINANTSPASIHVVADVKTIQDALQLAKELESITGNVNNIKTIKVVFYANASNVGAGNYTFQVNGNTVTQRVVFSY